MFGQAQDYFVLGHFLAAAAAAVKNCVRPGEILQCAGPEQSSAAQLESVEDDCSYEMRTF